MKKIIRILTIFIKSLFFMLFIELTPLFNFGSFIPYFLLTLFLIFLILKNFMEKEYSQDNYDFENFIVLFFVASFYIYKYKSFLCYSLIIIFITIIIFLAITDIFCKTEVEDNKQLKLIKPLEKNLEKLNSFLKDLDKKALLIIGVWGSGKTHFIKYFFQENSKEYIPIWLKSSLYDSKKEMRDFAIDEINHIIAKNGIGMFGILKLFNLSNLFPKINTFIDEGKSLKNKILLIQKKIVLIVDDLDRIEDKTKIKEYISLISEFEEYFSIKIIYLVDTNNIFIDEKSKRDEEYLNKYFCDVIVMNKVTSRILIEKGLTKLKRSVDIIFKVELENAICKLALTKYWYIDNTKDIIPENFMELKELAEKRRREISNKFENKFENIRFTKRFFKELEEKNIINFFHNNEEEQSLIITSFLLFYFLKDEYKKDFQKLCTEETYSYQKHLNASEALAEKNDIYNIVDFFDKEGFISKYFLKIFFSDEKLITKREIIKNKINDIKDAYSLSEKKDLSYYNYDNLLNDMFFIVKETNWNNKEIKCFFKKYIVNLKLLYQKEIIDIIEILNLTYRYGLVFYSNEPIIDKQYNYFFRKIYNEEDFIYSFYTIDYYFFWNYDDFIKLCLPKDKTFQEYRILRNEELFSFSHDYLKENNVDTYNKDFPLHDVAETLLMKIKENNTQVLNDEILENINEKFETIKKHINLIESVYNFFISKFDIKQFKEIEIEDNIDLNSRNLYNEIMRISLTHDEIQKIEDNWEKVTNTISNDSQLLNIKIKFEKLKKKKI
ncbi:hypothetical protein [Fusobacterium ulcerans]|uniref:hypothetical protein n=1 Tax=Fusobacterium ulcerans TaxID=861 RepID=UPI001D0AEDEA|nr:hypothetical protein [Fusobacterium ulcerans]MCB8566293.1 hypothetical protein [Fusobacterium ulcerans]MCB8650404.1 hypothetical protein [Fusobacterium ulcerans]